VLEKVKEDRWIILAILLLLPLLFLTYQLVLTGSDGEAEGVEVGTNTSLVCANNSTGLLRLRTFGSCNPSTEKKFSFSTTVPDIANGFIPQNICIDGSREICHIGATGPGGGLIFFVDYHNEYPEFNYLEVAPPGWGNKGRIEDPASVWCDSSQRIFQSNINSWSARAIGRGPINSRELQLECPEGAMKLIKNFNENGPTGYKDWFMPSLGELILIANNLQGLAGLTSTEYWSSSEHSATGAWAQGMSGGYQGSASKATLLKVRPIRAF
jgi:hypothetical protein